MKAGAIDFLTKPFRDQDRLDAARAALDLGRQRRLNEEKVSGLQTGAGAFCRSQVAVEFHSPLRRTIQVAKLGTKRRNTLRQVARRR